jgi:hypothetical protein
MVILKNTVALKCHCRAGSATLLALSVEDGAPIV